MNLKHKAVWITGASSGIGEALVKELNREGARLIISSRNREALYQVKMSCKANIMDIHVLPLDLEDLESLPLKAAEALKIFGRIDVLIHCAGISQRAFAIETTFETDLKLMKVNYLAPVRLTKSVLPFMEENGGHIIAISSVTGKYGTPYRSGYAASKHALHGFFDSLRAEMDDHVKITLVCPGFIRTNLSYNALKGDGSKNQVTDPSTAKGIAPEICAKKIIDAIKKNKQEVVIAGIKERTGLYVKRFLPGLFARLIKKVKVI